MKGAFSEARRREGVFLGECGARTSTLYGNWRQVPVREKREKTLEKERRTSRWSNVQHSMWITKLLEQFTGAAAFAGLLPAGTELREWPGRIKM